MAELLGAGPPQLRRSPLAHLADRLRETAGAVTLRERPFLAMVSLRVDPASPAAERIGAALGVPLPRRCAETAACGPHTVLWLGPDEWLVVSETPGEPVELTGRLCAALADDPGSVVDVSGNRTTLELSGPAAREVLEKGCATDLHPRSFGPGRAVTTQVGPVPVLLWQTGAAPAYRLMPRGSFADHLARWLLDAMSEYGVPEPPVS